MQSFTFLVLALVAGLCAAKSQFDPIQSAQFQNPGLTYQNAPLAALAGGSRPTGFVYHSQTFDNPQTPASTYAIPQSVGAAYPYGYNAFNGYNGFNNLYGRQFGSQIPYYNQGQAGAYAGYSPYAAAPYGYGGLPYSTVGNQA